MLAATLKTLRKLARDESAAAISEYAFVIGCVIVVVVLVLSVFGSKLVARWETVADKLDGKTATRIHVVSQPSH